MVEILKSYKCKICQTVYDLSWEAEECEAQGVREPSVQVGDIVLARAGFGWYDGDKRWISNPSIEVKPRDRCPKGDGNCFSDCCTYAFYYVVTAIDLDESEHSRSMHRRRYHLFTRAMAAGYRRGYTFDKHHVKPRKVEAPPAFVVRSSKGLIGQKAGDLL